MINLCLTVHRDQILTDNHRLHRYQRAAMVRTLRQAGKVAALAARPSLPVITDWPVVVQCRYQWASKQWPGGRRPRDAGNLNASTKAIVDGLTDSGLLWPDDGIRYVDGQDSRLHPDVTGDPRGLVRVVITVRKADALAA